MIITRNESNTELKERLDRLEIERWGALEALHDSEKRFRLLAECLPDAILIQTNGRYVYANQAALDLYGASTQEDFIGRSVIDFIPPDELEAGATPFRRESKILRFNGQTVHVEITSVQTVYGGQAAELLLILDITDQKLAEATEGIAITENGRITYVNEQMARIFGYDPSEMIGMEVSRLIVPEDLFRILDNIGGGWRTPIEIGGIRKNGGLIAAEAHGRTIRYQGRNVRITAVVDITERNRAGEALRIANIELENVVKRTKELSRTVQKMEFEIGQHAKAEEGLREHSRQLRALASTLTLTEQRERERIAQVLHDHLQQLLVSAKFQIAGLEREDRQRVRQIAQEVKELIDLSIETSRSLASELSPPILQEGGLIPALEWIAHWMKEKYGLLIELKTDQPAALETKDVTVLIFQAVRELLLNVAKYAKTNFARVHINHLKGRIEITVTDEGIGFDSSQLRPKSENAEGFGLFALREHISLQGGYLEIKTAPGRGCRIRFSLPNPRSLKEPLPANGIDVAAPPDAPDSTSGRQEKIRILLADDHKIVREGLRKLLQEHEDLLVAGEAEDGAMAVSLAREIRPDVVLMDISMPVISGIEATRIIHSQLPHIRIIGLSMFAESEQAAAMREAGAADYLSKTCPSDEIIKTIQANSRPPADRNS